jgi:hypothetical protein
MTAIVLQLQQDALNRNIPVTDLLRKALVIAKKLKIDEFKTWIENELKGYDKDIELPDYRHVSGEARGWNPYQGWVQVIFSDPKRGETLSRTRSTQSIAEIERLILGGASDETFHMPFSQKIQRAICESIGLDTQITLFISNTSLIKIIETVRTIVLNWTLKLEEDGILGEGFSFTEKEQKGINTAHQVITNFYGPMQGTQIQHGNHNQAKMRTGFDADAIV